MASKRMFSNAIVDSDAFLEMPLSTQALYFHFGMRADDDGFVNAPKKIQRMIGGSDDDVKILIAKGFIIPFDSGVIVITHWKIHNTLKSDRHKPTAYQEEKALLAENPNKSYALLPAVAASAADRNQVGTILEPDRNQVGTGLVPQYSIDKNSIDKSSIDKGVQGEPAPKRKRFTPPTLEELTEYIREHRYNVTPRRFLDYYDSNGWMVGKNHMKDWRAAVRNWNSKAPPIPHDNDLNYD